MNLVYTKIATSFDDLNEGYLVAYAADVDLTAILSENDDEFILRVECCVENGESLKRIIAVRIESILQ